MMHTSTRRAVTHPPWVLAGDVGGTKVNLACLMVMDGVPRLVQARTYRTAEYPGMQEVLAAFLDASRAVTTGNPRALCLGCAGPIVDGRCRPINYPWTIDREAIRASLKLDRVELINDMQALAYGCLRLEEGACEALNAGQRPSDARTIGLLAAGTGLGETIIHQVGGRWHPIASEGGNASFAPTSPLEDALLGWLRPAYPQVSFDLLGSGRGIALIYQFLKETQGLEESEALSQALGGEDPAAAISAAALEGRSALCEQTMNLFVRILGAEAGNLALKALATGGVFIGGGIPPKILPFLRRPAFMEGFVAKYQLEELMRSIPVRVILDPQCALWGAADRAWRAARGD